MLQASMSPGQALSYSFFRQAASPRNLQEAFQRVVERCSCHFRIAASWCFHALRQLAQPQIVAKREL
ncbi:MAG TPA: hypothetical protein DDZ88_11910 [Verrucomicrobiales bacterium]|nr:hypothetical protein [Verrucomicrobiales bacterium]